ncbi:hypothetical protein E4U41_000833 [Claviceps citrina]|nr:hypothetical protein E4U41_000833 [Claviceps citrina]
MAGNEAGERELRSGQELTECVTRTRDGRGDIRGGSWDGGRVGWCFPRLGRTAGRRSGVWQIGDHVARKAETGGQPGFDEDEEGEGGGGAGDEVEDKEEELSGVRAGGEEAEGEDEDAGEERGCGGRRRAGESM